jgi:hypothetical protein
VTKNGYNRAFDPHFQRFRADFLTHSTAPPIVLPRQASSPGTWWGFFGASTSTGRRTPHSRTPLRPYRPHVLRPPTDLHNWGPRRR